MQISVCKRRSRVTSNFVCDRWLYPQKEDQIARCYLEFTKAQPLRYIFRVLSQQSMRDQHVWVSIFTCPQHSTFTRVQRLSCGFTVVLLSMLANIMFYKAGTTAFDELRYGELVINLDTLIISAQSAFIVLPISGLIILIFRLVKPRQAEFVAQYGGDQSVSPRETETTSEDNSVDTITEHSYSKSIPSIGSISSSSNDSGNSSSSSSRSSLKSSPRRISSAVDDLGCAPFNWNWTKKSKRNTNISANAATPNSVSRQSSSRYSPNRAGAAKSSAFTLPWWCVYLGWTLTISSCLISSFFVIAYGLSNTHYKNVAWTLSFFMSASGNIFVIQPVKVAILVVIATFLFTRPIRPTFDVTELENLGTYM